jgi:hypothetical protein
MDMTKPSAPVAVVHSTQPHKGGSNERELEAEIQAKGLNAPRLTPAMIDAKVKRVHYHHFPGTTLTVCAIELQNGFLVVGESAAASPDNFDHEIGRKIAFDNARQKIWSLEGYLLREQLALASDKVE